MWFQLLSVLGKHCNVWLQRFFLHFFWKRRQLIAISFLPLALSFRHLIFFRTYLCPLPLPVFLGFISLILLVRHSPQTELGATNILAIIGPTTSLLFFKRGDAMFKLLPVRSMVHLAWRHPWSRAQCFKLHKISDNDMAIFVFFGPFGSFLSFWATITPQILRTLARLRLWHHRYDQNPANCTRLIRNKTFNHMFFFFDKCG